MAGRGGRGQGDFRDSFFSSNIPLGRLRFLKNKGYRKFSLLGKCRICFYIGGFRGSILS